MVAYSFFMDEISFYLWDIYDSYVCPCNSFFTWLASCFCGVDFPFWWFWFVKWSSLVWGLLFSCQRMQCLYTASLSDWIIGERWGIWPELDNTCFFWIIATWVLLWILGSSACAHWRLCLYWLEGKGRWGVVLSRGKWLDCPVVPHFPTRSLMTAPELLFPHGSLPVCSLDGTLHCYSHLCSCSQL